MNYSDYSEQTQREIRRLQQDADGDLEYWNNQIDHTLRELTRPDTKARYERVLKARLRRQVIELEEDMHSLQRQYISVTQNEYDQTAGIHQKDRNPVRGTVLVRSSNRRP